MSADTPVERAHPAGSRADVTNPYRAGDKGEGSAHRAADRVGDHVG